MRKDWILQPGDGAHPFPGPSAPPKSMSQQDKMPLVLSLGPQDTDQNFSPVLGQQVCKAVFSLQQSSRMAPNREKQTQKKLSGPAPFEYTRLQPQTSMSSRWTPSAGSSCRRPQGQDSSHTVRLGQTSGMTFRAGSYHVFKIKFGLEMGLLPESLQLKEHTVLEGSLLEQAYGTVPSQGWLAVFFNEPY